MSQTVNNGKKPIRPGLYRNAIGVQLRVIESANPQLGPYQILGNVWIGAVENELGSRAVLATTEFLHEVYEPVENPAGAESEKSL